VARSTVTTCSRRCRSTVVPCGPPPHRAQSLARPKPRDALRRSGVWMQYAGSRSTHEQHTRSRTWSRTAPRNRPALLSSLATTATLIEAIRSHVDPALALGLLGPCAGAPVSRCTDSDDRRQARTGERGDNGATCR
jgi:hypothetical protein